MSSFHKINSVLKTLTQKFAQNHSNYSIVSAITYAYFSYLHNSNDLILPVLNFTRNELNSRKDAILLLKNYKIDTENLFFSDDLSRLSRPDFLQGIHLVDHNTPQGSIKSLKAPIVGIIDHHEDEGQSLQINPRIIEKSGSCSSLVFKYWFDQIQDKNLIDPDVFKLLLGPLVIDTTNLTSKIESTDLEVFKIYQEYLSDFNTESFFSDIKEAKNNIEGLSAHEIFAKDYKDFEVLSSNDGHLKKKIGVTSIVKPFKWLQSNFENLNELSSEFLQLEKLDFFIIMTSFINEQGDFNRELGIISQNESNNLLEVQIVESIKDNLSLEKVSNSSTSTSTTSEPILQIFNQKNLSASRKQVIPVFKKSLEKF
ncbi:hypothetical protein BN7_4937 [Wickerhamomyces ciferrii]|uniref:DHHA2 domain-containing protein n=1 Tax=Wickerhamomyces ciferrii (strain ATCC 14091 / BCRC 22168 / CBS 111 / JCM 3599 / NBRC 0793 / NRRL Y-1031 F-60-10) TaxID=1206466 RepID=K0KJE1_WICCF|nr:uncharacterized protein BN7_4937 [Wickerhamomyces ciferrii]CCH45355.1 hypothetical protein BN7_4937 [Wickerhamomyces ciferrii]